jgi:uracil-DNA glycosylase
VVFPQPRRTLGNANGSVNAKRETAKRTRLNHGIESRKHETTKSRNEIESAFVVISSFRVVVIDFVTQEPSHFMGNSLTVLHDTIIACRQCPRLVAWREKVAREKHAAFRDEAYWGKPVPGFGDPQARLLIVGLAPAAHGGNRTGRVFTGDRSGDWLYAALYRAGFANQRTSTHRADGLRLHDCYITACVRCAPPDNKPLPGERDRCLPFLVRELQLLRKVRVVLCLGAYAWSGALRTLAALDVPLERLPKFGHGAQAAIGPFDLMGCYHPSQQNTFTGRLTQAMLDKVLERCKNRLNAAQ